MKCPICDEWCHLVTSENDVYVGKINKKVWVDFLSYECDHCFESFTDTEIDIHNQHQISISIKKYQRMLKIKNIQK